MLQATQHMAYREIPLSAHTCISPLKLIERVFENPPKSTFSSFSSNEIGGSSFSTFVTACSAAVQRRCISFQNFALCEITDRQQSPTARLGCRFVCTTSGFAQETDAKPVGGRGISAFSIGFFWSGDFSSAVIFPLVRSPPAGARSPDLNHHSPLPCAPST